MSGALLLSVPCTEEAEGGRVLLERVPVLRELFLLDTGGIGALKVI